MSNSKPALSKVHCGYLACLIFLCSATLHAQTIDILLKGGHVIDPKNNIDGVMDVAISNNKISQVAANIPVTNARKVIDAKGL